MEKKTFAMRLKDAGKSMVYLLFIVPVYAFVIGCYESEELHEILEICSPKDMKQLIKTC